jgi:RNA polymerase sigma factor (TIGR02999 family)
VQSLAKRRGRTNGGYTVADESTSSEPLLRSSFERRHYNRVVARLDSVDITQLLTAWRLGDPAALERLMPLVYDELRAQARRYMRKEQSGVTLQTTALVHEVYLRLVDARAVEWQDRVHFFALSATLMRRILVDRARARTAVKRGGRAARIEHDSTFDLDQLPTLDSNASTLCALDDALKALTQMDRRRASVVELRFFGGLSVDETAEVLQVSPQTVMRDWRLARAWLGRELSPRQDPR